MDGIENAQTHNPDNNTGSKKDEAQENQSIPSNGNSTPSNPETTPPPSQQPETQAQNPSQVKDQNPQVNNGQIPETETASAPQPPQQAEQDKAAAQHEETQNKENIEKLKVKNANAKKIALSVILVLFIAAVAYIFMSGLIPIAHKITIIVRDPATNIKKELIDRLYKNLNLQSILSKTLKKSLVAEF